ncbi:hypothetical protein K8R66_02800 [bacterium]|nr:hypothetical protein [bacterium]
MDENKLNNPTPNSTKNPPLIEDVFSGLEGDSPASKNPIANASNISQFTNQNPISEENQSLAKNLPREINSKKNINSGTFLFIFFMIIIILIGAFAIWALL